MSISDEAERIKKQIKEEEMITVNIALFGQPGAGKSSIINRILGQQVAPEGVETDFTKGPAPYSWENQGLLLWDLPGYDTPEFPKDTYWDRCNINDYDCFLCVVSNKFHDSDKEFFTKLRQDRKPCLFVRNKADDIFQTGKTTDELKDDICKDIGKQIGSKETVYFTSCRTGEGLGELSKAMNDELGTAKSAKFARYAKAYSKEFLEVKRKACEKHVWLYAGLSAANALNPIPGLDVAVDFSVLLKLFTDIRNSFGLTHDKLNILAEELAGPIAQVLNNIIKYGTQAGIALLIEKVAGREALKEFTKYVPFVGQAIAASIGFAITYKAGSAYLDDCYEVAKVILEKEMGIKAS